VKVKGWSFGGSSAMSRRQLIQLGLVGMATVAVAACSSTAAPAASAPTAASAAAVVSPTTAAAAPTAAAAAPTAAPTSAPAPTAAAAPASSAPISMTFFYPVGVAGPLSKLIDGMTTTFNSQQNGAITVTPVYSGDYLQTLSKAQTALQGGKPPEVAVLNAAAIYTLQDMQAVIPLDDLVKASGGTSVADDFFPAFLANSKLGNSLYSLPFQRSTLVFYYNPDLLSQAGLGTAAPKTWDEVVSFGQKLTQSQGGTVTRWGVGFPSSGSSYWEFQAVAIEAGQNVMGDVGNQVYFNTDAAITALQWLIDLSHKYKVMNTGTVDWGNLPTDFAGAKTAMIYHSTGSLSFIAGQAKFKVGVAFDPQQKQFGSPTGGGNLYIFRGLPAATQDAAWKFVSYMSSPATLAQWSISTGYVAPRKACYDLPVYQDYTTKFPQALVARDQLQYAQNELGTHQMAQVQNILSNAIQAALTGKQSPKAALDAAQSQATSLISSFPN
jgi:sn-glycerol 3-phosphate transport system substrate-binding protein